MNDIDFVKKCCEYADGFWVGVDGGLHYPGLYPVRPERMSEERVMYKLLLLSAIEGVNEKSDSWYIEHMLRFIGVNADEDDGTKEIFLLAKYKSIDATKRAALEYVFEQEG